MNFRVDTCPVDGAWRLSFGEGSHLRFDQFGRIEEVYIHRLDRQFRHTAQRIARDAAARTRAVMVPRGLFGARTSAMRRTFLERVAKVANAMEEAP